MMKKTKPTWEETRRALEVDVEFELRTTAPQVEMEQYYARKKASLERKIRKINKKIKKNIYNPHLGDDKKQTKIENEIKKRTPPGSENIEKYRISTEYTLISYTTPHYLVFRYYSNSETYLCETRKSIVLWWISPDEKEKLLAFEMKKKEKFKGLKVYDGTTEEGL